MVGRNELDDFFHDDPEGVVEFIDLIGTERDVQLARLLPPTARVDLLWALVQNALATTSGFRPPT